MPRETLRSGEVYERLRLSIASGEIRPNEPLIEADIAEELGVSRTPVRESLQRLGADGLIVPRKRGWAVREFTRKEIQENYEVRAGLEGLAARYAAERGSEKAVTKISTIHKHRLQLKTPNRDERVATNRKFHDAIIAAADNTRLREMIFTAGNFYLNRRVASLTDDDQFKRAQKEHGEITAAILRRDPDRADVAMRHHIMAAFEMWLRFVD